MSVRERMSPNRAVALLASGLLGASAALLASCGSTAKLIPLANSEPLQKDFQEVASAAENSHGSCSSTEAALAKAQQDFESLPASVDAGLRRRLSEGLTKLRADALELCNQPAAGTTATTAPRTTPTNATPTTTTNTTPTQTTPSTSTTAPTTTTPGGGTPAGEEAQKEAQKEGGDKEKAKDGEGGGVPPNGGGQEGGK
jgi:hypothetical protein